MPKALPVIDMSDPVCCAPVAAGPLSDADALEVAMRLKALADPARVKIMSLLFSSRSGEETSGDLAATLDLAESTGTPSLTGRSRRHRRRCVRCSTRTAAGRASDRRTRCDCDRAERPTR